MTKKNIPIDEQRHGVMTPEQLEAYGVLLVGQKGWQGALARGLGCAPSTITRYRQGKLPVPQDVGVALAALLLLTEAGVDLPKAFTSAVEARPGAPTPGKTA